MEASVIHPAYIGIWSLVKLLELANKSRRSPVNQTQLLHPNPWEASEDRTAIVKAAEHKTMNKGDDSD